MSAREFTEAWDYEKNGLATVTQSADSESELSIDVHWNKDY